MNIVMIPARGGSKRIPRKNIRLFRGRPIISYSIEAAIQSNCFDKVIVSTDCDEIASIAKSFGADVPFIRPKDISNDFATTQDVVSHCINWLIKNKVDPNYFCCLYATAPFVTSDDIKKAFGLLSGKSEEVFAFTATEFSFPIQRAIKINHEGKSNMFFPENFNIRSQDLEKAFHDAGQFYIARPITWQTKKNLFEDSFPIVIPNWRVQDIDVEEDWERAELLHELLDYKNLNK